LVCEKSLVHICLHVSGLRFCAEQPILMHEP
jgi:hypothetical protein